LYYVDVLVDYKQCGKDCNVLAKKHTNFSLLLRTKIWFWNMQVKYSMYDKFYFILFLF